MVELYFCIIEGNTIGDVRQHPGDLVGALPRTMKLGGLAPGDSWRIEPDQIPNLIAPTNSPPVIILFLILLGQSHVSLTAV